MSGYFNYRPAPPLRRKPVKPPAQVRREYDLQRWARLYAKRALPDSLQKGT